MKTRGRIISTLTASAIAVAGLGLATPASASTAISISNGTVGVPQIVTITNVCPSSDIDFVAYYSDNTSSQAPTVYSDINGNASTVWTPSLPGTVVQVAALSICSPVIEPANVTIAPAPAPVPSYTVTGPSSAVVGSTVTYTVRTTNGEMLPEGTWELRDEAGPIVAQAESGLGATAVYLPFTTPSTPQVIDLGVYYSSDSVTFTPVADFSLAVTAEPSPTPAPIPPNPAPAPQPAPAGSTLSAPTGVTAVKAGNEVLVHYAQDPYASQHAIFVNGREVLRTTDPTDAVVQLSGSGPWVIGVQAINGYGTSPTATLTVGGNGAVSDDRVIDEGGAVNATVRVSVVNSYNIAMRKNSTTPVSVKRERAIVKRVAAAVKRNPNLMVAVHGFQDAPGCGGKQGCHLDDKRAVAVEQMLVDSGIPLSRILTAGGGVNGNKAVNHGAYANVMTYTSAP